MILCELPCPGPVFIPDTVNMNTRSCLVIRES
jgi:hypothetical protein